MFTYVQLFVYDYHLIIGISEEYETFLFWCDFQAKV